MNFKLKKIILFATNSICFERTVTCKSYSFVAT